MKVAVYSGNIPSTTFIERLIRGLADRKMTIQLFGTLNGDRKPDYDHFNIEVYPTFSGLMRLVQVFQYTILLMLRNMREKQHLDRIIARQSNSLREGYRLKSKYYPVLYHRPDIFHLQWAKSVDSWQWVQEFGVNLVVSLRGAHINYSPLADKQIANMYETVFPNVDSFHAVSRAIAKESVRYKADPKKVKVINSGLPLEFFTSGEKRSWQTQKKQKFLSIGRSHWVKGYHFALLAMKKLKDSGMDFQYDIVAGKNEELIYMVHDQGLTENVSLMDKLPFEQVMDKMKEADLLLLPSVEEGIANVVLEAMALGTPVVSTNCGGMAEVIKDGVNGWLVPVRDPKEMAAKIMKISRLSENEIQKVTKVARLTIEDQHTEEKMVEDMINLYDRTLAIGKY